MPTRSRRARSLGAARRLAIDISPLRSSRDFRLLWGGQFISLLGRQVTTVALPFQVYTATRSSLAVGLLGLVQLFPLVAGSMIGGVVADRVDRRHQMLFTQSFMAAVSLGLVVSSLIPHTPLGVLYALAGMGALVAGLDQPARGATTPNLVAPNLLSSALALNFAMFAITAAIGPIIGGLVIQNAGLTSAYLIDVITFAAAIGAVLLLSPQRPSGTTHEAPLRAVLEGFRFIRRERPILGGFLMDINAMVFGLPRALFPALATGVYHVGPIGLGLLYAAPAVGATIGSFLSGFIGTLRHPGRAVVISVMAWGLGITIFGLGWGPFAVGLGLLGVAQAADAVSAIARGTILQTIAPDNLRGRLTSVNFAVVVGGPYLGDVESGAVATAVSVPFAIISGGVLCIVGGLITALALPQLWNYERPRAVPVPETTTTQ